RLAASGDPCVYLDARAIHGISRRFPTVTAACRAAGIDPTEDLIPVVPGAHYSCGGVVTNTDGRTELEGPFAARPRARTAPPAASRPPAGGRAWWAGGAPPGPPPRTPLPEVGSLRRRRRRSCVPRCTATIFSGLCRRTHRWFVMPTDWTAWSGGCGPRPRVRP